MLKNPVSLQINLSPGDYLLARHILPHQLNVLAKQVDEIVITVESKASKGRFAEGWLENKLKLAEFLEEVSKQYSLKIVYVDYSPAQKKKIGSYFFGLGHLPDKDFRGGPFYCYFFGLYHCKNDLVMHLDADIFLGGLSKTWIAEATHLFSSDPDILTVSPLPGPPTSNQELKHQEILYKYVDEPYKYVLNGFSTRLFLIDKSMINRHKLRLKKPAWRGRLQALLGGNSIADLPEHFIADLIKEKALKRIDFLGNEPGLWSLHPPYRTKAFYEDLPKLIEKIEKNDLPPSQAGFYDVVDELVDWSEPRNRLKTNRWWKNILKRAH